VQNVVTYNAVVDVGNPKRELLPGMTANIEVVTAERADVVRVPNAAVRFHPPGELAGRVPKVAPLGKKLVWVLRGGIPEAVAFEPGISDGTYTEVVNGLSVGDLVITEASATNGAAPRIL
jgi:HlyD family secretion protein